MTWDTIIQFSPQNEYVKFDLDGVVYSLKLTPKYPCKRLDGDKYTYIGCAHETPRGLAITINKNLIFIDKVRGVVLRLTKTTSNTSGGEWDTEEKSGYRKKVYK